MTDDASSRREPIVARRDLDLGETKARKRIRATAGEDSASSGGGKFILAILLTAVTVGLVGLGWFSWQQSVHQALLQNRFDALAAKIESTDESLSQSGAALSVKLADQQQALEKHWSEIRKLWGVSNDRNKRSIKALEAAVAEAGKLNSKQSSDVAGLQKALQALSQKLAEQGGDSLAVTIRLDELDQRIGQLTKAQLALREALEAKQVALDRRIKASETAIDSIDAFRRQTNQTLNALRQGSSPP